MNPQNKIIVITGAASGLGFALSKVFRKAGARVISTDINKKELTKKSKLVESFPVPADITKEKDVLDLVKKVIKKFGRIDVWVNNAGLWAAHAPVEKLDTKKLRKIVEVNLLGTIYSTKAALIEMKKKGEGVIVNIISTSALEGRPGSSGYCASKYGVVGFTKSLALEVKDTDIKVLAIYPGGMKTHLFDEKKPANIDAYMDPEYVATKILENFKKENPDPELVIRNSNKVY